ncbi:hypothetical protein [Gracilibacillus alcaliphilus]|uniref:hypothetical protein n=1 Tax=Gracilibacillus alcaliphilus TaxID=1401441 RepID=UPI0019577A7E|nr:hypothetical protein [Gracilibacillus alcaliphilus]MBM7678939.1 hypothetical protein [Gracilibacillus alcaliphilus]
MPWLFTASKLIKAKELREHIREAKKTPELLLAMELEIKKEMVRHKKQQARTAILLTALNK